MSQKPIQKPLWSEHIYKALDDAICAIAPENRNPYEWMGEKLWPTKGPKTQYARCKACLDPTQENTNFNPEEFIFVLVEEGEADIEIAIKYLCDALNRHVGEKKAPKSPKTILLERQALLAAESVRIQQDIDRLDAAAELKAIK